MSFNENIYFGNFFQNDGTIDFYLRIRTLINENSSVLDYGAGRAKWLPTQRRSNPLAGYSAPNHTTEAALSSTRA